MKRKWISSSIFQYMEIKRLLHGSKSNGESVILLIHLLIDCDHEGRGVITPYLIKGDVFPATESVTLFTIVQMLEEIHQLFHNIVFYTHKKDNKEDVYFEIQNLKKYIPARIGKFQPSKLPAPSRRNTISHSLSEILCNIHDIKKIKLIGYQ